MFNLKAYTEKLKGGLADNIPDSKFNLKDIKKGLGVEKEHTKDKQKAKEIVKDHLIESPEYYDYLEDMEKEMK